MKIFFSSLFFCVSTFLFLVSVNSSASESLSYSGRLVNPNGSPVAGPVNLKVELAYSNTPGTILCSQDFSSVVLSNGVFHLKVNFDCGVTTTLSQVLSQVPVNQSAAIRVTDVSHSKAYAFQALHSMPFAKISETARQLDQMGALDGQVLKWSNAASKWKPGPSGSSGTVSNVSASAPLSVINSGTTPDLTISKANSTTDGYLSAADWTSFNNKAAVPSGGTNAQYLRGDNSWQTLDTSVVPESGVTNLYFSNARVLGVPLTGFVAGPGVIVATDTVLQAMEKTQGQIDTINSESSKFLIKNGTDSITGVVTVASPTGFLRLIDPPAIFTDATNMAYVDSRDDLKVNKNGDTMSGLLTLDSDLSLKGGTNYVTLKAHAATANYNFVFPQTVGTSGFVLSTDGSGNTTWVDPAVNSSSIVNGSIVDADINAAAEIAQTKIANLTTDLAGKEPVLANPNDTTKYYRGDKSWQTLNTTEVPEGLNLYFLNSRVLGVELAGLNTGVAGPIAATDTVLGAFGKLQNQITTANAKGQWEKNVNDIYYNAGKVGIGTNTPNSALEVKGVLRLAGSNSGYVGLAPATDAGATTYTLPAADGSSGQILKTNGAGVLSWVNDNSGAGAFSGAINKAMITDGTGALGTSATTATELGYVSGVTSSIQTQLNAKQSTTLAAGNILVGNGSNVATAIAPTSDVSMTNAGAFTVTKLQGSAVATTAPGVGSVLKWDNVLTQWTPVPFSTCSGSTEVMHYNVLTDTWSCDALSLTNLLPVQATNGGKVLTTDGTTATWQTPATGDNLGNHTATQNLNLATFKLVGEGGTAGLAIRSNGSVLMSAASSTTEKYGLPEKKVLAISGNNTEVTYSNGVLQLSNNRPTPSSSDLLGEITFASDGTNMLNTSGLGASITSSHEGAGGANGFGASLKFSTAGNNTLNVTERMRIDSSGNVGIGTITPGAKLEVAGQVKITGGTPGAGKVLTSDATGLATWEAAGGGGISSFNGLAGATQAFAIPGTAGSAPNWSSSGTDHTINIPMAATAGVTAGLISKTDYDVFSSKLGTTLTSGNIWVGNGSNAATAVTPSSDVSMTNAGAFTVTKLQGRSVATTAPVLGSYLKWDNILSQWAPSALATCSGANQVMHYILLTDTWSCDTLNIDNLLPTQTGNSGKVLTTNGTTTSWQTSSGGDFMKDGSVAMTGQFKAANGTSAVPSISFSSETNTGFYYKSANDIGWSVAGSPRFSFGTSIVSMNAGGAGIKSSNGTAISPAFFFQGDGMTGMFSPSTNNIAFSNNGAEKMRITPTGNVGIGTTAPGSSTSLNVAGQIKSGSASITTGTVDWVSGNSITTTFDCGSNITLANLRDGGSYTLVVTGSGSTQCNFSTTTTGDDANTVSYRFKPTNGVRTASSHTVYSLLRIGTIVYVSWISGF